jgi:fluoroacetyl-CoA thioesterase
LKADLEIGASEETTITTTAEMGIVHLGPGVPSMFSTPAMVSLIEGTCVALMSRYMDEGEQTVGYRVDIRHLAPTAIGKKVTARVTLSEIKDGRRFAFDVECHNEDGAKIGEGRHWRALIDISRFAAPS